MMCTSRKTPAMTYTLTGMPRSRPDPMAVKKLPETPMAFASVIL